MKKYFAIVLQIYSFCLFAQMKTDTIQTTLQPAKFTVNLKTNHHFIGFNQLKLYTNNDFSMFNKTSLLNDNFSVYKGQFEYKNSVLIPQNMFFNSKIDSLNPNGVSDFGSALLMGALNLTLGLFDSK